MTPERRCGTPTDVGLFCFCFDCPAAAIRPLVCRHMPRYKLSIIIIIIIDLYHLWCATATMTADLSIPLSCPSMIFGWSASGLIALLVCAAELIDHWCFWWALKRIWPSNKLIFSNKSRALNANCSFILVMNGRLNFSLRNSLVSQPKCSHLCL